MKLQSIPKIAFLSAFVAATGVANAAVFNFTDGNLILGFQATGGQGVSENVFVDLGSPIPLRNNGNAGVLVNVNSVLSSVYGDDWYTRTDLYFGVIANLNSGSPGGVEPTPPVNGDPSRTFYVSRAANSPGSAALITASTYTSSSLGTAGSALRGLEQVLIPTTDGTGWNFTNGDLLDDGVPLNGIAGVLNQTTLQHAAAWNNSWTVRNPTPGAAFSTFTGGIQQNFGKVTSETYVDLQRILATNTGAVPTGVVGGGTYETTIAISSTGSVSASTPAPASAFTTWINTFNPPLTNSSDRLEAADPDNDEIENVLEFVLNGNPSVSSTDKLPVLNATGTDFVFSFTRRADSAAEVAQVFEYSADLVDWTTNPPVTIPTAPGTSGFATVGVSTGTAPNQVQAVTITIPKGSNTKLFGRLRAIK
jgi:hypothetical protein